MSMEKPYVPSTEELKDAEENMTEKEKDSSESREYHINSVMKDRLMHDAELVMGGAEFKSSSDGKMNITISEFQQEIKKIDLQKDKLDKERRIFSPEGVKLEKERYNIFKELLNAEKIEDGDAIDIFYANSSSGGKSLEQRQGRFIGLVHPRNDGWHGSIRYQELSYDSTGNKEIMTEREEGLPYIIKIQKRRYSTSG